MKNCYWKWSCLRIFMLTVLSFSFSQFGYGQHRSNSELSENYYPGNNPNIHYVGRIDFSNPKRPKIWAPGAYMKIRFKGSSLKLIIGNEDKGAELLNHLTIVVDHDAPHRLQLSGLLDTVVVAKKLKDTEHTATIVKDNEGDSYIEMLGILTHQLLPFSNKLTRKIEFIGNSITSGYGNDNSIGSCDVGDWFDHENAYMSFGAITARKLKAQWVLSSVSGIGMMHSHGMKITMPDVYDKINMKNDSILYHFDQSPPDVVVIGLGQNDGIQDSTAFSTRYINFLKRLRKYYPQTQIVCLTSPMADHKLNAVLQNYIAGIVQERHRKGDDKVSKYFFRERYTGGCHGHPTVHQDRMMAKNLSSYLARLMNW